MGTGEPAALLRAAAIIIECACNRRSNSRRQISISVQNTKLFIWNLAPPRPTFGAVLTQSIILSISSSHAWGSMEGSVQFSNFPDVKT